MLKAHSQIVLAVLNVVGFVGVVVVNALANALPIGGKNTGQISDQYPNYFVPSGKTFLIWAVIYVLLAIYVIYGLIQSIKMPEKTDSFISQIGLLFFVTCIANAAWIFSWHHEVLPFSLVCMVVLLVALAVMYERLNIGRSAAGAAERYLVHLPVSVYFGWISVATIANVTALLVAYRWNRFGISEQFWAIIMIGLAAALALVLLFHRKDVFYALVVDWAVLGILIKQKAESQVPARGVMLVSVIGIAAMTLAIVIQVLRGKVYR